MASLMRVLGVDPGFDRLGFGVVDMISGQPAWVTHGVVQTSKDDEYTLRLQMARDGLKRVLDEYKPQIVVVEQLFFQSNAKTAMKVGMARGVILLTIADAGLRLIELTPNQVKQGIAGWGGADKKQMQMMVARLLKLKEIPKPDDAADALALAMCGAFAARHPGV